MNEESGDPVGPFITVVSVDGGLRCGNKLTVITPTEIADCGKKGNNSNNSNSETDQQPKNVLKQGNHKGKVSAIPTLVGVDRKPTNNGISSNGSNTVNDNVTGGTAYVTVVSLAEQEEGIERASSIQKGIKSGIPVKSVKNHINTKSIVQLENKSHNGPTQLRPVCGQEEQIITISNKVKGHYRNSSYTEISSKDENENWQSNKDVEIPTNVIEQITVLRLPGKTTF